jgi:hypothetical protein
MYSPPETLCAICGQKKLKPWTTLSSGQLVYSMGAQLKIPCIPRGCSNFTDVIGPLVMPNQLKNQMSRWSLSIEIGYC